MVTDPETHPGIRLRLLMLSLHPSGRTQGGLVPTDVLANILDLLVDKHSIAG